MRISHVVLLIASLHAGLAEARFGKKSSGGSQPTHAAVPVDSAGSSSSSGAGASSSSAGSPFRPNRRLGYFNGAFVPLYGYGAPVASSVYPFWQIDGRAGLVVGMGALGIRVGWRTLLLDDQGVVDGVEHRDIFMGPYAGLGFAF